jgi:cytidine deaminase
MPNFQFAYHEFDHAEELPTALQPLLASARSIVKDAYAPYSNFKVGASILFLDGQIVHGVNIENASYPVGICAERSALASALSQYPSQKIVALAVSYFSPNDANNFPAFPCGMCRQFISECEDRNQAPISILVSGQEGKIILIDTIKHLLPFAFGGSDLGK